jgi:hypothetical protein
MGFLAYPPEKLQILTVLGALVAARSFQSPSSDCLLHPPCQGGCRLSQTIRFDLAFCSFVPGRKAGTRFVKKPCYRAFFRYSSDILPIFFAISNLYAASRPLDRSETEMSADDAIPTRSTGIDEFWGGCWIGWSLCQPRQWRKYTSKYFLIQIPAARIPAHSRF